MKNPLLIIGAGNVGGYLALNLGTFGFPFEVKGFLDDDPKKAGRTLYGKPVLGPVESIRKFTGIAVAIGIAAPKIRRRIVDQITPYTVNFPPFVAPSTWISDGVQIGKGSIIYPGVSVNYETDIGEFCIINMNCAIGHNCTFSGFDTLAPGVNLAGFTFLEQDVDIGIGVSTRQRVRIGTGAVIGGQSMVINDIPPDCTAFGVPARVRRARTMDDDR